MNSLKKIGIEPDNFLAGTTLNLPKIHLKYSIPSLRMRLTTNLIWLSILLRTFASLFDTW